MRPIWWRYGRLLFAVAAAFCVLAASPGPAPSQERVEVSNPEELLAFFERIDYTPEAWQAGVRDVPRAYIMTIGDKWRINSKNIEVIDKKRIFFRALAPLVLRANELILQERARLLGIIEAGKPHGDDAAWIGKLAADYGVTKSPDIEPDEAQMAELGHRIDMVPVSLVLAQGAEESGWGTSRFAEEGNALFGQWTWGGKGIKPKEQRQGLGNYGIAAYDTPLESVQAYMRNINTHDAYTELRKQRAQLRQNRAQISGWELAKTLTNYSERGEAYVDSLHAIMRVNKLQAADEAVLIDGKEWHIYPAGG